MNRISKYLDPSQHTHNFDCECDACQNCEPVGIEHDRYVFLTHEAWQAIQQRRRRELDDAFRDGIAFACLMLAGCAFWIGVTWGLVKAMGG